MRRRSLPAPRRDRSQQQQPSRRLCRKPVAPPLPAFAADASGCVARRSLSCCLRRCLRRLLRWTAARSAFQVLRCAPAVTRWRTQCTTRVRKRAADAPAHCDVCAPPLLSCARATAELAAECRQCCAADDSAEPAGPFDSAALEVCPWRLSMHAELREFAEEAAALYGTRFRVKSRSGLPPTLVLSSKGVTPQRIRVDAWNKNAIADYLSTRLAAAPPLTAPALADGEL